MKIAADSLMDCKFGDLVSDHGKTYEMLRDIPMSNTMSYRRPQSIFDCWTFWSNSAGGNWIIAEKIKSTLVDYYISDKILIQFWAPMRTDEGCVKLVTSNQPFALSHYLHQGLVKYRKHCMAYEINVDGPEELLGIPGRVFRNKWHEMIRDSQYYSTKEYPHRDFAATCDISCSLGFPVFDPSYDVCLGVLEFVAAEEHFINLLIYPFVEEFILGEAFKNSGLRSSFYEDIDYNDFEETIKEIRQGSEAVCKTHSIPLAFTWTSHNVKSFDAVHASCIRQVLNFEHKAFYALDESCGNHLSLSKWNDLQKEQGVAGRAYTLEKPCLCKDITQFTLTQYPLLPYARHWGLTGCFAVCLQNTRTKKCDFVLEFFLPRENTYGENPSTFLRSILETMIQHFPSFKVGLEEQLVKGSWSDVSPCRNQEPTSFQFQSIRSPSGLGDGEEMIQPHSPHHQLELDPQLVVGDDDISNVSNAEENNIDVCHSDKAHVNPKLASFQCQSTGSPPGLGDLNKRQEMMPPHSSNQQQMIEVDGINNGRNALNKKTKQNNGRNVVNAKQNNTPASCLDEADSITFEELKKHFGKKLEDAAQDLGVSRSTLKRICRKKGISRWKQGKRTGRDAPCFELPTEKLVATVSQVTPLPEVRTITIKAKYGDEFMIIELPFSARMVDLKEEVSERLNIKFESHKIIYIDGDGDRVLIACDKDLKVCISASNSSGMNPIKMFIEPISNISPST